MMKVHSLLPITLVCAAALGQNLLAQSPIAYWPFDQNYSSAVNNASFQGTPIGSVSISPAARIGNGALRVDDQGGASSSYSLPINSGASGFTISGTTSLGNFVTSPSNFNATGTASMDLTPPRGPFTTGQFTGGNVGTNPTTLNAYVPNPIPFLPHLVDASIQNARFQVDSSPFAITSGGAFSASVVMTPISGTVQITPLVGSSTTINLATAGPSTPTVIAGTVTLSGNTVNLSVPLNPTFNLSDPATGLSATIQLNGTVVASTPLNPSRASYVDIANRVIPAGQNAFTIVGWYRYSDVGGNGSQAVNTMWETPDPSNTLIATSFALIGNRTLQQWTINDTAAGIFQHTHGPVDDGLWHHVAIAWNKSARTVRYYRDGAQIVSLATTGADLETSSGLHIGDGRTGDGTGNWDGYIDDLAVFDGELSATFINRLYNGNVAIFGRPYGSGCHGASIGIQNLPRLGSNNFTITLDGAPASALASLGLGDSRTMWSGLPLPFDLSPLGAPGCSFLASRLIDFGTMTNPAGHAAFTIPIPSGSYLSGFTLYSQWIVIDLSANPAGIVLSDGLEFTLY